MRGGDLSVVAGVRVPVEARLRQQRLGVGEAERLASERWLDGLREGEKELKAPPLGFERRAFSTNTEPEGN